MMIMGEICTRGCTFCNVATGRPDALDVFEPGRVAVAVEKLGLNHVVITSVDRDDLEDGGAEHIAQTIRAVRRKNPGTTIEVLVPDFLKCAAGGAGDGGGGEAGRLQPQPRDGAGALSRGAAGGAVFPLAAAAAAGEGARSGDVHQVGDHGRARRGPAGGLPGDGRHARGGRRFPDHRPVPAADAEAPRGGALRDAGGVRRLREGGVRQGLPDGLGDAADPVELPRRRRLRAAAGGAAGASSAGPEGAGMQAVRPFSMHAVMRQACTGAGRDPRGERGAMRIYRSALADIPIPDVSITELVFAGLAGARRRRR